MADDDYLARVVAEPAGGWLVAVLPRAAAVAALAAGDARWRGAASCGPSPATRGSTSTTTPASCPTAASCAAPSAPASATWSCGSATAAFERQLTAGDWMVTDVAHVDEARGEVLFIAHRRRRHGAPPVRGPARRGRAGPAPVNASPRSRAGTLVAFSRDGRWWTDRGRRSSTRPPSPSGDRDGQEAVVLHAAAHHRGRRIGRRAARAVHGAGRRRRDAARRRPLPAGQTGRRAAALRGLGLRRPARPVREARLGDDASTRCGSTWRSAASPCWSSTTGARPSARLAFEAPLAGQLGLARGGGPGSRGRDSWRRLARSIRTRVGITGGSYGGFMTLMAAHS